METTIRDDNVLAYLGASKGAPTSVIAEVFFKANPQNGRPNGDAMGAARRRLAILERASLVTVANGYAFLTETGLRAANVERVAPVVPRDRPHHAGTLRAIEDFKLRLPFRASVLDVRLEHSVRQGRIGGRRVHKGRQLGSLPDACVTIRSPGGGTEVVALEYVSAKYTDQMILDKQAGFAEHFKRAVYYADTPATARRVQRLLNEACPCI